jgi:hypothetical protein
MQNVLLNAVSKFEYRNPAHDLRRLRKLERQLQGVPMEPRVRRLRTGPLRRVRENLDAALFTHGMAQVLGKTVYVAYQEADDYDFVTAWLSADEVQLCPVQLKELVPTDLNPDARLDLLLDELTRIHPSEHTALAIRLNRTGHLDFNHLKIPPLNFRQLWFFGATRPGSNHWFLYGDFCSDPSLVYFDYPR